MLQDDFLAPLTPQDFLQRVLATMSKLALDDTQRQLVIEACLGYFILNYPPPQLVAVVRKVSQKLESVVEMSPGGETNKLLKYIASTQFEYYGVLEEEPKQGSKDQLKTMLSCTQPIGSAPMLALQLNAH